MSPCLGITLGQRELLHSSYVTLVLAHIQYLSGQCVGLKTQHHCLNFRHTWKAIPASELPCEFSWVCCWNYTTVQLCSIFLRALELIHPIHSLQLLFLKAHPPKAHCIQMSAWKLVSWETEIMTLTDNFHLIWKTLSINKFNLLTFIAFMATLWLFSTILFHMMYLPNSLFLFSLFVHLKVTHYIFILF